VERLLRLPRAEAPVALRGSHANYDPRAGEPHTGRDRRRGFHLADSNAQADDSPRHGRGEHGHSRPWADRDTLSTARPTFRGGTGLHADREPAQVRGGAQVGLSVDAERRGNQKLRHRASGQGRPRPMTTDGEYRRTIVRSVATDWTANTGRTATHSGVMRTQIYGCGRPPNRSPALRAHEYRIDRRTARATARIGRQEDCHRSARRSPPLRGGCRMNPESCE
jgi:hypothetical protein